MLQVSPCMERAVLNQLADYFETRLAGYPTTLSEDEELVNFDFQFLNHWFCMYALICNILSTFSYISWQIVI